MRDSVIPEEARCFGTKLSTESTRTPDRSHLDPIALPADQHTFLPVLFDVPSTDEMCYPVRRSHSHDPVAVSENKSDPARRHGTADADVMLLEVFLRCEQNDEHDGDVSLSLLSQPESFFASDM